MRVRVLSEDEHDLIMLGLAQLHDPMRSVLIARLHPATGHRLLLVDLRDEQLDQSEEVPG